MEAVVGEQGWGGGGCWGVRAGWRWLLGSKGGVEVIGGEHGVA